MVTENNDQILGAGFNIKSKSVKDLIKSSIVEFERTNLMSTLRDRTRANWLGTAKAGPSLEFEKPWKCEYFLFIISQYFFQG